MESLGVLQSVNESHHAGIVAVDGGSDFDLDHAPLIRGMLAKGNVIRAQSRVLRERAEIGNQR